MLWTRQFVISKGVKKRTIVIKKLVRRYDKLSEDRVVLIANYMNE